MGGWSLARSTPWDCANTHRRDGPSHRPAGVAPGDARAAARGARAAVRTCHGRTGPSRSGLDRPRIASRDGRSNPGETLPPVSPPCAAGVYPSGTEPRPPPDRGTRPPALSHLGPETGRPAWAVPGGSRRKRPPSGGPRPSSSAARRPAAAGRRRAVSPGGGHKGSPPARPCVGARRPRLAAAAGSRSGRAWLLDHYVRVHPAAACIVSGRERGRGGHHARPPHRPLVPQALPGRRRLPGPPDAGPLRTAPRLPGLRGRDEYRHQEAQAESDGESFVRLRGQLSACPSPCGLVPERPPTPTREEARAWPASRRRCGCRPLR